MNETIRVGDRDIVVQGARADGTLRSGDVVELRVKQESPLLDWFAPDPLEAAENVAQAFSAESLTIADRDRPDVRGWVLVLESVTGYEQDQEVYVEARLRVASFDTRPPEMIEPEELEAAVPFVWFVTAIVGSLALIFASRYALQDARVFAQETGLSFKSPLGFGVVDAVIALAVAWVLVSYFKSKGVARG